MKLTEDVSHGKKQKNKPHKASLEALGLHVFSETESDNKPAQSMEDTIFLEIMDQEMYRDTSTNGSLLSPLEFPVNACPTTTNRCSLALPPWRKRCGE